MKYTPLLVCLLIPFALFSQQPTMDSVQLQKQKTHKPEHNKIGFGIKAGFNFANVTDASSINSSSRAGYHFGIFLAPQGKSILGSRTELIYSRHGFNYATDTANGSVNLDYIMLAQLIAIHITKYFDIQLGGQTAYLLSVKTDSSQQSTGNAAADAALKSLSYYNRLDSGIGAGVEIHPVAGLAIGARYCYSFSNLYKQSFTPTSGGGGGMPSVTINPKNNVILISVGYIF